MKEQSLDELPLNPPKPPPVPSILFSQFLIVVILAALPEIPPASLSLGTDNIPSAIHVSTVVEFADPTIPAE